MRKTFQFPVLSLAMLAALPLFLGACGEREEEALPRLGDIMLANQARHAKLWFAGQAENWPLASYELDELEEGFEEVVEYHPTHEESPVSLAETLPPLMKQPIADLRSAIGAQSPSKFAPAFDSLTRACNACHQATNYSFNVITRPASNWFVNQDFTPIR
jgi:hypothetical protein